MDKMIRYLGRGFFFLMVLMAIFMGVRAIHKVFVYAKLDQKTSASIDNIKMVEKKKGRYQALARYHFIVKDQRFEKEAPLSKTLFSNRFSIQAFIQKAALIPPNVYYNGKDPEISSLERAFPFKEVVYFLIVLAVLIYFSFFFPNFVEKEE